MQHPSGLRPCAAILFCLTFACINPPPAAAEDPGNGGLALEQFQAMPADTVPVEVYDVYALAGRGREEHVVFLHDAPGKRFLQVWIGPCEARAIHRKLHEQPFPRPLTHDLIVRLLEVAGMEMKSVLIDELRPLDQGGRGTFFAAVTLAGPDGSEVRIDARPSDAMAVAVRTGTPISVARRILDDHGVPESDGPPGIGAPRPEEAPPPDKGFY